MVHGNSPGADLYSMHCLVLLNFQKGAGYMPRYISTYLFYFEYRWIRASGGCAYAQVSYDSASRFHSSAEELYIVAAQCESRGGAALIYSWALAALGACTNQNFSFINCFSSVSNNTSYHVWSSIPLFLAFRYLN